jgi:predicted nucleotidyltransferase
MTKNIEPANELARRIRERLGSACQGVILFGSRARDKAQPDSDYDLLILVDHSSDALQRLIQDMAFDAALELNCLFSPVIVEAKQFEIDRYEPLFANVRREGLAV